jgi:hypothetical protein
MDTGTRLKLYIEWFLRAFTCPNILQIITPIQQFSVWAQILAILRLSFFSQGQHKNAQVKRIFKTHNKNAK